MQFSTSREGLLKPLQTVTGVIERRQTMPILSNILVRCEKNRLVMTGTDLEIELIGHVALESSSGATAGATTVPGRKLFDLCRALPPAAKINVVLENDRMVIRSGEGVFVLNTLPAENFPVFSEQDAKSSVFALDERVLRHLMGHTHFAMAQQDTRHYLNGMFLELKEGVMSAIATDGHRLAQSRLAATAAGKMCIQVLLPRKGALELMRLLVGERALSVVVGTGSIRVLGDDFTFTSKLIEASPPNYRRAIPRNADKTIRLDREAFKQALGRVSILSGEPFQVVRFQLRHGALRLLTNNPEQEEAEEVLVTPYEGAELDAAYNAAYLLDALSVIDTGHVKVAFAGQEKGVVLEEDKEDGDSLYVVMPLQI